jgi:hypothetical protein
VHRLGPIQLVLHALARLYAPTAQAAYMRETFRVRLVRDALHRVLVVRGKEQRVSADLLVRILERHRVDAYFSRFSVPQVLGNAEYLSELADDERWKRRSGPRIGGDKTADARRLDEQRAARAARSALKTNEKLQPVARAATESENSNHAAPAQPAESDASTTPRRIDGLYHDQKAAFRKLTKAEIRTRVLGPKPAFE